MPGSPGHTALSREKIGKVSTLFNYLGKAIGGSLWPRMISSMYLSQERKVTCWFAVNLFQVAASRPDFS